MNVDFYKSMHEAQIKRNEHFTNELRLTISILVILGSAFGYILPNVSLSTDLESFNEIISLIYSIGGMLYVIALYYLVRAYLSPQLIDLAPSQEWFEHEQSLIDNGENDQDSEKKFNDHLAKIYSETSTANQGVNDKIGGAVESSNKFLLFAFILILPSLIFSQTIKKDEQQPIVKVECVK
ncbi:MAG: hypothetical protein GY705_23080 [Bacteroidetes bacterium]|nr:hypothetical protein [Bacteroidota bacterium]